MALTVTPGGASDDALVSLADFQAYCTARGYALGDYTDTQQEQAIRRATVWVEGLGAPKASGFQRWPGARAAATQRRLWPRAGATYRDGTAIPSGVIPAPIEEAVSEAAFFDLGNTGQLHANFTPAEIVSRAKAGPAEVTYEGATDERAARLMLSAVQDLLADILLPESYRRAELFVV